MENLLIEQSTKTPYVSFNTDTGQLLLRGRSISENPTEFFSPVIEWLEKFLQSSPEKISLDVELEYYNTSSSMWLLKIFKTLESHIPENADITINWYYYDDDSLGAGEDFDALINVNFEMIDHTPDEEDEQDEA